VGSDEVRRSPAPSDDGEPTETARPTFMQRRALKSLKKQAHKNPDQPLAPEDWAAYIEFTAQTQSRVVKAALRALPSTPRCGYCGAPFAGLGGRIVRPLGYRPSRKNPNLCSTCVELAPPGGMTAEVGVLFADIRGFTAESESMSPQQVSEHLRRFYAMTERVLFPEALIDKLIGDEVMALYIPLYLDPEGFRASEEAVKRRVAAVMLGHARELLERAGYGGKAGPELALGLGLDLGEVFIGNVGDRAVHDFTAIGDVVNTASRLQGQAASGEVVVSARLAAYLDEPPGPAEDVVLKGKQAPVAVHRVRWF
jgi:adenylate cyclase